MKKNLKVEKNLLAVRGIDIDGEKMSNNRLHKRKLKVDYKNLDFGLKKITLYLILLIFLFVIIDIGKTTYTYININRVSNLVNLVTVTNDYKMSMNSLHAYAINTIVTNNTKSMIEKSSFKLFENEGEYLKKNIIELLENIREKNIGSLTDYYRSLTGTLNLCNQTLKYDLGEKCEEFFNGWAKTNLLDFSKGILVSYNDLMQNWNSYRYNIDRYKTIMNSNQISSALSKFEEVIKTIYDTLINQFKPEFNNKLNQLSIMGRINLILVIFFVVALIPIIHLKLIRKTKNFMINFMSILYMMPTGLLEKNMVIRHRLINLRKGKKLVG